MFLALRRVLPRPGASAGDGDRDGCPATEVF